MSWETPGVPVTANVNQVLAEESARTFMARVYRWMFVGLAVTGVVAAYVATNEALLQMVYNFRWGFFIGQLALVWFLSAKAPTMSGTAAGGMFLLYAVLNGLIFSFIFIVYTGDSIGQAFLITGGVFGAMSAYATFTKKSLSGWGTFLFMGLIGVLIAGVVQIFVQSPGLSFVWSCACVIVFAGLTAYDTQKLRNYHASSGYSSAASLAVSGALMLYLDFVNLFMAMLRLFGRRR